MGLAPWCSWCSDWAVESCKNKTSEVYACRHNTKTFYPSLEETINKVLWLRDRNSTITLLLVTRSIWKPNHWNMFSLFKTQTRQLRHCPKLFALERQVSRMFQRDILRKLLDQVKGWYSLSPSVLWLVLHFSKRARIPHNELDEKNGRSSKWARSSATGPFVEEEASGS